ncbi:MAG: hypothetical protein ACPGYT_08345 [Nitrospirales bacterium]
MKQKQVLELVTTALHDLNEELQYPSLEEVTEMTPIFGGDDSIDSLSLVQLLVGLEKNIATTFDCPIALADEKAMSWKNSPYRTVGALIDFILSKIDAHEKQSIDERVGTHV